MPRKPIQVRDVYDLEFYIKLLKFFKKYNYELKDRVYENPYFITETWEDEHELTWVVLHFVKGGKKEADAWISIADNLTYFD